MLKCVLCKLSDIHVDAFGFFFLKMFTAFPLQISCFVIKIYKKTQEKLLRLTMWPIYFLLYRFKIAIEMLFLLFQKLLRRHEGDKTWNVTIQKLEKWQKSSSYQHLIKNILLKHLWYEIFNYAPPQKKRQENRYFPKIQ